MIPTIAQKITDLKFNHFGLSHGLSQVTAMQLLEDDQGYIWVGTQDGLNRFNGYNFKTFRSNPEDPHSLSNGHINCMIQTSKGQIIVGTNQGLNLFDGQTESFNVILSDSSLSEGLSHNNITALLEDRQHRVWFGTENGLNLMYTDSSNFQQFSSLAPSSQELSNDFITALFEDQEGNIWIGTKNGLNCFNNKRQTVTQFYKDSRKYPLSDNGVNKLHQDQQGILWVGTEKGLTQFDFKKGQTKHFLHDPFDPNSLSADRIFSILEDSDQNLWIGTATGGLNLYDDTKKRFTRFQSQTSDPKSLSQNTVWSILEDRSKNLWVGVSSEGVNFHNPQTRKVKHYRYDPSSLVSLQDNAVRSVLVDNRNQLWVGSFTGLTIIDRENNLSRRYQHHPENPHSLSADYVLSLLQDHQNRVWLGTGNGLNLYDARRDEFIRYSGHNGTSLQNIEIGVLREGHQKRLWIGTINHGVFLLDADKGYVKSIYINQERTSTSQSPVTCITQDSQNRVWVGAESGLYLFDDTSETLVPFVSDIIKNNGVLNITEGQRGEIWVGTNNGLYSIDPITRSFQVYHEKDGLSNSVIYGNLIDDHGKLWLSTNKGINQFDPETETFIVYDEADGFQANEFNSKAYYKDNDGLLYFGGVRGLSVFHPDDLKKNEQSPRVVLTDFLLFNQSVAISDSSVLKQSLDHTEEIVLTYDQDMFAFEYSALNYRQAEKNQFAYKLEPFHRDWIYTDATDRKAVFTRIPAGDYTFLVKASNDDGVWNEAGKSIQLTILPPWWRSWWAILGYVFSGLCFIGLVVRFQWKRIQLKNRLRKEQQQAEQFRELDKMKSQFFSNITHEFRTPLTLILGPSEQILKQSQLDESFTRTQVELIKRSSQKFLKLVNQLLDLSKIESSKMSVERYQGNLNEFLKNIVENFQAGATQKHIQLNFQSTLPVETYVFDRDKTDKILSNLLSNALKFTPEKGSINVALGLHESKSSYVLQVQDTGIGIAPEQLPHIFDRFYQVEDSDVRKYEGTGIGLALTKELITLIGGKINVESRPGIGTTIFIEMPLRDIQEQYEESTNTTEDFQFSEVVVTSKQNEVTTQVDDSSEKPVALIVEDNADLRSFIESILTTNFQTITASDGVAGIDMAFKHIPDLIISDVMMPLKDGFELTKVLKENPISSHIPIILLTAKSNLKSRIEGLQRGADAYLSKPFSVEELALVADRQIANRKAIQDQFQQSEQKESSDLTFNEHDQELINNLHAFIESQLGNQQLIVDELAKEAGMSHSQLYRKIKALTGFSVAGFIRNYRLTRAMDLLTVGKHNVSEVSNLTGFENRSYFYRVFVAKYGLTPSDVIKSSNVAPTK